MSLSILLVAPLIGLLLSLFAAGGGLVAVPLLNAGLGMPLKQAIAASLMIVASTSLIALIQKKGWRLINWRLHRFFAVGAILGGFSGAAIGLEISEKVQAMLFPMLVLLIAWWINSNSIKKLAREAVNTSCNCMLALFAGFASGVITGLLGVGGGFIIVPILMLLGVANHQAAVAHSLLLIISSSLAASVRYYDYFSITWKPVLMLLALAGLGVWIGGWISSRVKTAKLQQGFSFALCMLAVWMLYKTHIFDMQS